MAFGRLERKPGAQPMSDINMTPLIDVMLVLLVIFMLAAPLMSSSLNLELPRTAAAQPVAQAESITLAVTADGRWHLGEVVVTPEYLAGNLHEAVLRQPEIDVLVRADKSVPYGRVAELIGVVQAAGVSRVGFVAEPAVEK